MGDTELSLGDGTAIRSLRGLAHKARSRLEVGHRQLIMRGSECARVAARYVANKYLFQLLLTSPYRSRLRPIAKGSWQRIAGPPT
jgi:hypothetical protein